MSLFNAAAGRKKSLADSEIDISISTSGRTAKASRKSGKRHATASATQLKSHRATHSAKKSKKSSTTKSVRRTSPKTAGRAGSSPTTPKRSGVSTAARHREKSAHSSARVHQGAPRSVRPTSHSGSLFRVNRAPLAAYGHRTFLSDSAGVSDSTNINKPLSDRTPTPQEIEFVKTLNRKFKRLENKLQSQFRAYCGGSAGFVVRRYTLSCATPNDDILSAHKPIGMGPKGLDKYFMKHYKISWDYFLKTPSEVLELKIVKGEATAPPKRTRKKSAAAAKKATTSSTVRSKKRTPMSVPTEAPAKKSSAATKRTPVSTTKTKATAAAEIDYDKTEREMNELKQLLQQSIK